MAYIALGDDEMSRADYLSSINADPGNYRAWFNLGLVYKSMGNLDGALSAFSKSMELNPLYIEAGEQKVFLLLEIGDRKAAQSVLSDLKQRRPDWEALPSLQAELNGIDND
jgi:Tfp pilus assembly protein PilF